MSASRSSIGSISWPAHTRFRISAGLLTATIAVSIAAPGAQAVPPPPGYNTQSADVFWLDSSGSSALVSGPVSAQYNYPRFGEKNSGYAALSGTNALGVPVIALGSYVRGTDGEASPVTESFFTTSMWVGAGSSGAANGTPVTLQLSLQLDGTTSVTTGDDAGYANMGFSYRIESPDRAVYDPIEGGWSVPSPLSFDARVVHGVDNYFSCFNAPCGDYHDLEYVSGWTWLSNQPSGGNSYSEGSGGIVNDYTTNSGFNSSYSSSRSFDTGIVVVDFDTFVGDTLNINGFLGVWIGSFGAGSSAEADFLNTAQTSITSPYVAGLELIPGTVAAPVPEPESVWMYGTGLLLTLMAVARRRRMQALQARG